MSNFSKINQSRSNETGATQASKRRYNVSLIESRSTYTTSEIAALMSVHVATVRAWYREGLMRIDQKRPFLVLGEELRRFLEERQNRRRHQCSPQQMMCFRCRKPTAPLVETLSILNANAKVVMLRGHCSVCGTTTHRAASRTRLLDTLVDLGCDMTRAKSLCECVEAGLNTHFKEEGYRDEVQSEK